MEVQSSRGHGSNSAQSVSPQGLPIHRLSKKQLRELTQRLKPPASQKQAFNRPIHPDTVVLTFSLVVPFFIFGVLQNQAGMIVPLIVILVVAYGLYFWKRKTIIERFNQNLEKRNAAAMRIQRALARWMNLYYCARDEVVFEPGVEPGTPVDLISGYLMQE